MRSHDFQVYDRWLQSNKYGTKHQNSQIPCFIKPLLKTIKTEFIDKQKGWKRLLKDIQKDKVTNWNCEH